jgi:predicted amidohydrolase
VRKATVQRPGPGRLVRFLSAASGMRGTDFPVEALTVEEHDLALPRCRRGRPHRVHVLLPTERPQDGAWQNGAYLVQADGAVQGYQTKNQVPLEEEPFFTPGATRRLFRIDGLVAGVVVCHEGWRYPETVRWAAARGARLVLHPHFCGGPGAPDGPARAWGTGFYEKAMACRAAENHVWFASVNFAMPAQECATSVVSPDGECVAAGPLHREALVIADVDPAAATGYPARRSRRSGTRRVWQCRDNCGRTGVVPMKQLGLPRVRPRLRSRPCPGHRTGSRRESPPTTSQA